MINPNKVYGPIYDSSAVYKWWIKNHSGRYLIMQQNVQFLMFSNLPIFQKTQNHMHARVTEAEFKYHMTKWVCVYSFIFFIIYVKIIKWFKK